MRIRLSSQAKYERDLQKFKTTLLLFLLLFILENITFHKMIMLMSDRFIINESSWESSKFHKRKGALKPNV